MEQTLGLKWTGWVGAIVLLVGAALGVRFVYEQRWLAVVPNGVWLSLIALGGFGLIGIGEWAYRRVHVVPAASLFGAGIAALFLASYAGYAYYKIYNPQIAFALMGLATIVGAAVARRGDLVSIGILSLIGGNVAPIVLHTDHPYLPGFLAYLGMIEAVALILAFLGREQKWWILRLLSWLTNLLWVEMTLTGGAFGEPPVTLMLGASVAFAIGFQVELILSQWRRRDDRSFGGAAAAFSMLVAASLTIGGLWILRNDPTAHRTMFVAIEASACAALALTLRRGMARLSTSFAFQMWALAALLIPVALTGDATPMGWGILALAMALMGPRPGMIAARALAPAVWFLSVIDLAWRLIDQTSGDSLNAVWLNIAGTPLVAGLILAWMLAAAGEVVAWLTIGGRSDDRREWASAAWAVSLAVAGVWIAVSMQQLPPLGATAAILALAWILAMVDFVTDRLSFAVQGFILLLVVAVKWALLDGLDQRLSPHWSAMAHRPLANTFVGMGVLLAASFAAMHLMRPKAISRVLAGTDTNARHAGFVAACCVIGVLSVAFSLQIDLLNQRAVAAGAALSWPSGQMENLALTLLWSAVVAALWLAAAWADAAGESTARADGVRCLGVVLIVKFMIADTGIWLDQHVTAGIGANLLVATAVGVSLVVLGMTMLTLRPRIGISWPSPGAVALSLATLFWAGSLEIYRAVAGGLAGSVWPSWQLIALLWTTLWSAGAMAMYVLSPKLSDDPQKLERYRKGAAVALLLLGLKYLSVDTMLFRVPGGPPGAWVLANPQALAAAVLAAGLGLVWGTRPQNSPGNHTRGLAGFLMMLIFLWAGTLEIDRWFLHWINLPAGANRGLASEAAVSIFWGLFAVAAVAVGFRIRAAAMRYFGLGLFAVTLLKIVLVDLGQISTGDRVLSFMGLGVLLMGTSVLYGKLSPRLLNTAPAPAPEGFPLTP